MNPQQLQQAITSTRSLSSQARLTIFTPEAARGNDNTLWSTMASTIRVLTQTYIRTNNPIELFEVEIRDTWYLFILAAKNIDADHPAQDRLVRIVLWARGLGVLVREVKEGGEGDEDDGRAGVGKDGGVLQEAVTAKGRIWIDLPFFLTDLQDAWKAVMSPTCTEPEQHRLNLAAAIARLAGVGILGDALSGCGVSIFSLALESEQSDVSTEVLLGLVEVWLRYAGDKLLQLSMKGFRCDGDGWHADGPSRGELARDAGIDTGRMSRERFLFWRKRLEDLKERGEERVRQKALVCFNMMDAVCNSVFGIL